MSDILAARPASAGPAFAQPTHIAVGVDRAFPFLSAEYRALFEVSSATPFQHPIWLDALARRLVAHRDGTLVVITGRDEASGDLAFALPLVQRRKSGVLLLEATDLGVSDYAAPIVVKGYEIDGATRAAIGEALPEHDILRIRPVRKDHVEAWTALLGIEPQPAGFSAHATTLARSYAEWRAGALDGSFAKYLDRKRRRFDKSGKTALVLNEDPGAIDSAVQALARFRTGRFEGDMIQDEAVCAFYAEVARRGHAAGLTRTYSLVLDGEAIGHVFGLTHAGRFHYLLIGCDYDAHGRHSPGLILYDTIIEDWIADGGTVFDFTIGDESFKADFATRPTPMFEFVRANSWRGRLASAAKRAREELQRLTARDQ